MRERKAPRKKVKHDWAIVEANHEALKKALVRNLNANVLKDAAERSSNPPEDINKSGKKSE